MEPVLEGIACCDAKIGPHGHIMACLMGELRVLDSKAGSTISGISFKGYQIYSIQYYKDTVVLTLAEEGGTEQTKSCSDSRRGLPGATKMADNQRYRSCGD